jgi:aspartate dehydrogenase
MARTLRLAIIGFGAISRRVTNLLRARSPNVTIVGVAVRHPEIDRPDLPPSAIVMETPEALRNLGADLVLEAAGRETVEPWGETALAHAPAFAVSSTSAFAEDGVLARLSAIAERHGSQILIPPGALGAVDALAAASILPLDNVAHTIVKPLAAWRDTAADGLFDPLSATAVTFFRGSAREAARRFPQNANVTAITALAGIGLDRTDVSLVADPAATRNSHRVVADGAFGHLDITIACEPLATNPRSSEQVALALVRLVENQVATVVR